MMTKYGHWAFLLMSLIMLNGCFEQTALLTGDPKGTDLNFISSYNSFCSTGGDTGSEDNEGPVLVEGNNIYVLSGASINASDLSHEIDYGKISSCTTLSTLPTGLFLTNGCYIVGTVLEDEGIFPVLIEIENKDQVYTSKSIEIHIVNYEDICQNG